MKAEIDPRYPIGKFHAITSLTPEERERLITQIAATPAALRAAVGGLSDAQLDTPYREGGWTVRQVVHHVPDSHMNGYIRLKLALTEESPTVRPYDEAAWAKLPDSRDTPVETSLALLEATHDRWTRLLRAIGEPAFARPFHHPEHAAQVTVDWLVALYAWHGRHHTAHITSLRERMSW